MTREEIELAIANEVPAIIEAAINIWGDKNRGEEAASDVLFYMLQKSSEDLSAIINGGYLRYYAVKSLLFDRNNAVKKLQTKNKNEYKYQIALAQYISTATDKTYIYTSTEIDQLHHAISQLNFIEQKVVYHYMESGSVGKLAKRIAATTDGKGIPVNTLHNILKIAKQKIKVIIENEQK